MNNLVVKKAKKLQEKMLRYIDQILKSMAWNIVVPTQLISLILDFLCHSFLRPLNIYLPVAAPCYLTPNTEYIIEDSSTMITLQTYGCWRSIKSGSIMQVKLEQKRFMKFIKDCCKNDEKPHIIGSSHELSLCKEVFAYCKLGLKTPILGIESLRLLINKNILFIRVQERQKLIFESKEPMIIDETMHGNLCIQYNSMLEAFMIDCVRAWKIARKISRNKGIARLSIHNLVEISGNDVKQLPINYFGPQDLQSITYLIP